MKNFLVVCLILSLATLGSAQAPKPESFTPAEQFGDPQARSFFRWATSAGGYILRHDGFGEFTSPQRLRRVFLVRLGPRDRLQRVYYLEHERDLFLLCEIRGHGFYLVRMEQTKRKIRWFTAIGNLSGEDPSMDGDVIKIGETIEVSKANGHILRQD